MPLDAGLRRQQDLAKHEWRGRDDMRNRLDLSNQRLVAGHSIFCSVLHDDVGRGA